MVDGDAMGVVSDTGVGRRRGPRPQYTERVQVMVSPEQRQNLQQLAEAEQMSVSAYIRRLAQNAIDQTAMTA